MRVRRPFFFIASRNTVEVLEVEVEVEEMKVVVEMVEVMVEVMAVGVDVVVVKVEVVVMEVKLLERKAFSVPTEHSPPSAEVLNAASQTFCFRQIRVEQKV